MADFRQDTVCSVGLSGVVHYACAYFTHIEGGGTAIFKDMLGLYGLRPRRYHYYVTPAVHPEENCFKSLFTLKE